MSESNEIFANELHHPVIRKFKRRKVRVNRLDEIWAMDLMSMETIPDNGYKFVDVFSKYAFCTPLKDKSGKTVLNAVKDIVSKNVRQPEKIWVDRGSEFYNKDFLAWASEHNIIVYSTMVTRNLLLQNDSFVHYVI